MTSAERLVRNLCEARRQQIEEDRRVAMHEANQKSQDVPLSKLPPMVQQAVREHYLHKGLAEAAKKRVEKAGYAVNYNDRIPSSLAPNRAARADRESTIKAKAEARLQKLTALRTDATIDTIGKTPTQVRGRLERLRKDVARI